MTATVANPKVDAYLAKATKWQAELTKLRTILLDVELTEELKWGKPCYSYQGSNVVIVIPFKEHCALLFVKGALLSDPDGILVQPTENTQAARQLRLKSADEIAKMEPVLKAYINNAIEVEKAGLKVEFKKADEFPFPDEFQTRLDENGTLKAAFESLTPGRQRAYILHFSGAKQSKTRAARVEKHTQRILDGLGIDDA